MIHALSATVLAATLLATGGQSGQSVPTPSAREVYTAAYSREQALRSNTDTPAPTVREYRSIVTAYDNLVRHFPQSGYADDALWQGGVLASDAFGRFGEERDRATARRMLQLLVDGYPYSPFVPKVREALKALADRPAAPSPAPPAPATKITAPAATEKAVVLRSITRTAMPDRVRITLDLDGRESYLRGQLIYVAATIEVTLPASNLVAASFIVVGGAGRPLIFGAENYVNGWQTRAQIIRLPASGQVQVGFSKLGTAPGVRARDLVIARVGAPYSEVVTASAGQKTSRRSMWIQPYYANASESYADGAGFICGVPMIGKNSAHAAVPLATTPGAGLVIVPKPGVASVFNNTTDTAPAIALNLASLIPGYTVDKHIAVRCVNSVATLTADGQDQALVAWTGGSPLTGAAIFRGQNGAIGFYVQAWAGGVLQQNALSAAALSAANSGLVLDSVTPGANLSAGYFEAATAAGDPDETTRASLNSTLSANNWSPFGLTSAGIAALVGASKISGATAGASFTFPAICLQWET